MRTISACIEMLFADEAADFNERVRLAKNAGLDSIEFWRWTDKDLDVLETVLAETGIKVVSLVAEPMIALTDPANRPAFLDGLARSIDVAQRFGARTLIAQAGADLAGRTRAEQRAALVACLADSAKLLANSGVVLGVEPLNTLVDHEGYFLPSTVEALDIVDEVASPSIGIVYDVYHSAVMGELTEEVVAGRVDRICHVHIADHPGRNQPGTGSVDLRQRLDYLFEHGYQGAVGLEYRPLGATSASIGVVLEQFR